MNSFLTQKENIDYLKNKFKDNQEYYNNRNYLDVEKFFNILNDQILEHLVKIKTIDIFDITEFIAAHNYNELLYDYNFDVKQRLDHYVKFLNYVYSNVINYGVNINSQLEVIDIYNIKYNQMIQQEPSPEGYGISLYFNRN